MRGEKQLSAPEVVRLIREEVVVEEKVDGTNIGVWFDTNGRVTIRHRGSAVNAASTVEYKRLRAWFAPHERSLHEALGERFVLYGEWLYARHSVEYDQLPDFFLVIDLYDRERKLFLDSHARHALALAVGISEVPVLYRGVLGALDALRRFVGASKLSSAAQAEGLYVRLEKDGVTVLRGKWVRPGWLPGPELHWSKRPLAFNHLASRQRGMRREPF